MLLCNYYCYRCCVNESYCFINVYKFDRNMYYNHSLTASCHFRDILKIVTIKVILDLHFCLINNL